MIQISIQRTKIESRQQVGGAWSTWVSIGGGSSTGGTVYADGTTITGDATEENPLKVATALLSTIANKVDKNGTDRLMTEAEGNKLAGINDRWRGSYLTLTAVKTAVPVGNPGDEATIDAGPGTQAQKAIWDETDQDWYIGSGTSATVDQSINHGSSNAVAGGAVYNALENKVSKNGTDRLITEAEANKLNLLDASEKIQITHFGYNGILHPSIYKNGSTTRTITGYRLASNATDFSVTISGITYTKADITNVILSANAELIVKSVTINTGSSYTVGNAVLILR